MLRKAPAKINLGLHILEKRGDGFHDIQSVMLPIAWFDELRFSRSKEISFSSRGHDEGIDPDDNLCLNAARLLRPYAEGEGVHIDLNKVVPIGAGLGGGSSDAACVLMSLNEAWNLDLSKEELQKLALELGSDVPFFLEKTACIAEGRGEKLNPINLGSVFNLGLDLVVAMPKNEFVSTKEAYENIIIPDAPRKDIDSILLSEMPSEWQTQLQNDFELSVFTTHPPIFELKNYFQESGALYSSMSGSGASVFGIFESDKATTIVDNISEFSDRFVSVKLEGLETQNV